VFGIPFRRANRASPEAPQKRAFTTADTILRRPERTFTTDLSCCRRSSSGLLADHLADGVIRRVRRSFGQSRRRADIGTSPAWSHAQLKHPVREIAKPVALIAGQRPGDEPAPPDGSQNPRVTRRIRHDRSPRAPEVDAQSVPILLKDVPRVRLPGLLALPFPAQPNLSVRRIVRVVAPLVAVNVQRRVTVVSGRAGPGFCPFRGRSSGRPTPRSIRRRP
jgi:hypothetical protein